MKQLPAIFLIALAVQRPAQAQDHALDRGSLLLSGQISFTSTGEAGRDADSERRTRFEFNPSAQYFVLPRLGVGGSLLLQRTSRTGLTVTTYGVGPEVSYFFGRAEERLHPFVSASMLYLRQEIDRDTAARTFLSFGPSGGLLLMLNERVGLTGEFFLRVERSDTFGEDSSSNAFGFLVGIAAFIF